jgi:hypothetical protein
MADRGRCKWDRLRQLEEKLKNAPQQIEELKRKKKRLEEQLRGVVTGGEVGMRVTRKEQEVGESLVLGDSIIRNVESEHVRVQCFPGIRTEQLHTVVENRDLAGPDTPAIHVGTNDLRRTANLDYVRVMVML